MMHDVGKEVAWTVHLDKPEPSPEVQKEDVSAVEDWYLALSATRFFAARQMISISPWRTRTMLSCSSTEASSGSSKDCRYPGTSSLNLLTFPSAS